MQAPAIYALVATLHVKVEYLAEETKRHHHERDELNRIYLDNKNQIKTIYPILGHVDKK